MNHLFLIGISIYALFIGFYYIKKYVKNSVFTTFIILLFFNILLFFLVDLFTIKPRLNSVSGNGNLGLIILLFLVPTLLVSLTIWSIGLFKGFMEQPLLKLKKQLLYGSGLLLIAATLQIYFTKKQLRILKDHPYNPFEKGYHGNMINQYTNTLFFNGNTYGILIIITMIITILIVYRKRKL